jgi:hypothetical protein
MNQLFNENYIWIATPSSLVESTTFLKETAASRFLLIKIEQRRNIWIW